MTETDQKIIAYGWVQSKRFGGNLLLVCAECFDGGKSYAGQPMEFTGPFDEPIACCRCGKEVKSADDTNIETTPEVEQRQKICEGCKCPIEGTTDTVLDMDQKPSNHWHGLCWRIAGPYAEVRIPCMKSHKHTNECA